MKTVILFMLLSCQQAFAQPRAMDSLNQLFSQSTEDTTRLKILGQMIDIAFESDYTLALHYARRAVQLADKMGDKNQQPKFYETEGRMHANLLQLDSAMLFFNKAMKGYEAIGNQRGQATTAFKMAWVYKRKGDIDKALKADLKGLSIMEKLDDKHGMAGAYERVSEDLTIQKRMSEAMDYAMKSIQVCKDNGLKEELVYALSAAGNVCVLSGKDKDAYDYFDRALTLAKSLKFSDISITEFYNNRGNALKHLGRYKEAIADYQTTYDLGKKTNNPNALSASLANLGEVNLHLGNYKEALGYQLETVKLQEQNNDLANLTENYLHVSSIYENLGDYKNALAFHKKALLIRDSIVSVASDSAMSKMLTRYETEKKEATISQQQKEIAQQKKVQWLGGGILALLAAFIIFGIISYRIRVKRSRLLAARNAENELLLKEIHHRVKNNLEVVSSLLALQSAQIDDPHTKDAMQESQNRVQSIGIVHQKLYQGNTPGAIEMKDYFLNLSESVLDSFGADDKIKIELAMEKLDLDIDTAVPLGLIVNELLTNTLKYAFPQGQNGNVRIKLEKRTSGILHLEVSDDGVGKSAAVQGTGFGTQLVSLLTRQLSGRMHEEINNGTTTFFDFEIGNVA